ncbi:uncharacterized protein V6R79_007200 [Siganus canaliculatus]
MYNAKDYREGLGVRESPIFGETTVYFHGASSTRKSPPWKHSVQQQSTRKCAIVLHGRVRLIPILNHIREGLRLYGLHKVLGKHKDLCERLFVPGFIEGVDSEFLISALAPDLSDEGSLRRQRELKIINFLQDFLQNLEDGDLKLLLMDCEYVDSDDMLIDAIIAGIREKRVQERLLDRGEDLTLAKAVEIPQQFEMSQKQIYCPFCGSVLGASDAFCCACGKNIHTTLKWRHLLLMHTLMLHSPAPVQICVGVMRLNGGSLKPVRGKSLPLDIQPQWSSEKLLAAAVKNRQILTRTCRMLSMFCCTLMADK